ncbi:MAG TPA: DUF6687 family protein [Planktothrix sp.]
MRYVPYHQLGTTDSIIVDGAPHSHTKLTLSHWPGNTTPPALKHDLSAGIVLNYLHAPQLHINVEAASNNHFDEDGLIGLWALLNSEEALEREELLLDVASAGDFGVFKDRDAARIAFILKAWTRPDVSPLNQSVFNLPYLEQTMILYEELLPRLLNVLDRHEHLEQYWKPEDKLLSKSEEQIRKKEITIEEYPEIDFAVVTLAKPKPKEIDEQKPWQSLVHEMAIHNKTNMLRILLVHGQRYKFYYRYESWVELISRKSTGRVDLSQLCRQLSQQEESAVWKADGTNDITPALFFERATQSKISPTALVEQLRSFLASANTIERT